MSTVDNTRIIVSTVKDGKVQFGQAVMEQQPDPKRVLLVALDPDFGLLYWETTHRRLKPHTVPQHAGYSRCLRPFSIDDEPSFLGEGYELPKEEIPEWKKLKDARTNAKNKIIREIFA